MIKRQLETLLVRTVGARVSRRRGRALVLAYHNIVPNGERARGELSLHLPQHAFGEQLDFIRAEFDVVPLHSITRPRPAGACDAVAITFDDAYRGAMTAGVDELARRGLPATVFVAPAFVGGRTFWWDMLASRRGALDDARRIRLLDELRGDQETILARARADDWPVDEELPAHARVATEAELAAAVARGITLGAHSWSHPNLARLGAAELAHQLDAPLPWLGARFGSAVLPWLAYPYGSNSADVRLAAARAGYEGALAIAGGWHRPAEPPRHAIPRLNVSAGLSLDGFVLRAAGVLT
ncbi:MAG TPA: polysaccharide deacetylase family protein [Gemmatimonadaceae bacterium]|nr:polysaccharide deacetylase family protein [Gemmatimonadaceae bacterium]